MKKSSGNRYTFMSFAGKILLTGFFSLVLPGLNSCNTSPVDKSGGPAGKSSEISSIYLDRSVAMFDSIYKYYHLEEKDLFLENFPKLENDNEVSWLWPYVCLSAGVNCLMRSDVKDKRLIPVINGFDNFYDTTAVPGYASYPFKLGSNTKYYDDNAIAGIELIDAYEITGDVKFLEQAKQAMHFIYTGESKDCDGGIYWNEEESGTKGEKGMSSNGFGVYLALKLYQNTKDEQYLIFAKRIYSWTVSKLKNPENQIYWNGILPKDCSVKKDIWFYNTGIMILNAILFYEITGKDAFLEEAGIVAKASFDNFTQQQDGRVCFKPDLPWFKTVLLKSYIALAKYNPEADKYIRVFAEDIDSAWKNKRNDHGFVGDDWTGTKSGGDTQLLNEACIIEIYARLSLYEKVKVRK